MSGLSRHEIGHLCELPHTWNTGKILVSHHKTDELQAIAGAHGERFYRLDEPGCYRSAYRRRTVEPGRKLERTSGPAGLRPVPRQDRVPDKAREVALAGLHHLIESFLSGQSNHEV